MTGTEVLAGTLTLERMAEFGATTGGFAVYLAEHLRLAMDAPEGEPSPGVIGELARPEHGPIASHSRSDITSITRRNGESRPFISYSPAVLLAGGRRIRPCLMTTATTLLALLPILTSSGRGSDIMMPMAIPAFGGMLIALLTLFVVPVLYCSREEWLLKRRSRLCVDSAA